MKRLALAAAALSVLAGALLLPAAARHGDRTAADERTHVVVTGSAQGGHGNRNIDDTSWGG
ncbi:hypothetical protein P3H78_12785 [Streptomyces sp. K1PA1]|uniref:Uncharacterized protein n=2 Tax=Streptomyces tropicalis TaxID=3034234 RepID=A0ABT6A4B9_9ACTN|nr:hypothetical protein [Streptomyces tropicalis]